MKGFYKLGIIIGACASVASLILLVTIANHIARSIEEEAMLAEADEFARAKEDDYDDDDEYEDEDEGLQEVEKTNFPQE